MQRHEQAGGRKDDQSEHDRFGRGRPDIAHYDLEVGNGRRQELVDRSRELGKIDAERCIGDALRQQRQHDQPGNDEGAVADSLDFLDA